MHVSARKAKAKEIEEKLKALPFMHGNRHYTEDEVRQVIRIVFPTKTKVSRGDFRAYGLKHLMERISGAVRRTDQGSETMSKYCHTKTLMTAMIQEGFTNFGDNKYPHYNISTREYRIVNHFIYDYPERRYAR